MCFSIQIAWRDSTGFDEKTTNKKHECSLGSVGLICRRDKVGLLKIEVSEDRSTGEWTEVVYFKLRGYTYW